MEKAESAYDVRENKHSPSPRCRSWAALTDLQAPAHASSSNSGRPAAHDDWPGSQMAEPSSPIQQARTRDGKVGSLPVRGRDTK